ncbi:hypothetical protein HHI36_023286 [Cryptolaemus montrouzieri]|uniref:ALMS motif domain-containing protein n=1 Tax=Cryptolaemus montrouzieri TaxID=559131 RepID=A0ABD2PGI9_9CUCU
MGNIGSQSGQLKYKNNNSENLQWANSFPRTQTRIQHSQLKVLPEKSAEIRLRHTENGEILQTGGTLTGRQIQSKFIDTREIKKCGSEPHLHKLLGPRHADPFEAERERKFRKKYRAPPPPNSSGTFNEHSPDNWESSRGTTPKPRLFKTKIQSERKRSVPDYHEESEFFELPKKSVQNDSEKKFLSPSHRLSLPALNQPTWDFQGELKEATKRLRKIRSDDNDDFSSRRGSIEDAAKNNKLKTLDHHINRMDLLKLKSADFSHPKDIQHDELLPFIRSEASGKESSIEESPPKHSKEIKNEGPKHFYFGMLSSQSTPFSNTNDSKSKFRNKNYPDSESSTEIKHNDYDSDVDINSRQLLPKKSQDLPRFSIAEWKQSSSFESVMNPETSKEFKYSSEENEEPPRIFSIFPTRSRSNERSRSGDSGISGDGSPALYEDTADPLITTKNNLKTSQSSIIPGWTPQQDLGDDSSFEEESYTAGEYSETFESEANQRHVFSLSLPRDHHLASYANPDQSHNATNFDKIRRSVSGILNTINKKEAESSPENEKGNWFLNKSCSALNTNSLQMKYSRISDELDEFLTRNKKFNSGRLMYLPKADKPLRPRKYETRNRQKNVREEKSDRTYINPENITETNTMPIQESLQDSPLLTDRKTAKKKSKRFTFQSTIRQIERRRIAEKLSREAEKKEQQRLRELEVMQKVEKEFQMKRAREKVNIKQQLNRYSLEKSRSNSPPDLKRDPTLTRDISQIRSEPDGAVSSSPTSSLSQLGNGKQEHTKYFEDNLDYVNNNSEYKSCSDSSEDNRSKPIMQTKVLSEYRQPQREYKDYQSSKKHLLNRTDSPRQTTIHPKVTCKMPKSKGKIL